MIRKCPECDKLFALKKIGKKFIGKENINMAETLTQPHLKGEIQTMVERMVPGEKKVFEITYVCRFCGAKKTKFAYKNIKKKV